MPRSGGFTLIEVLAVLVIIGVIVGFATLSLGNRNRDVLDQEARRLAALMPLALQEAMLSARELGFVLDEGQYAFLVLGPDGWRPMEDDVLRTRTLAPQVEAELAGDPPGLAEPEQEALQPQILFLSSGQITPFELTLRDPKVDGYFRLTGAITGEIRLTEHAAGLR